MTPTGSTAMPASLAPGHAPGPALGPAPGPSHCHRSAHPGAGVVSALRGRPAIQDEYKRLLQQQEQLAIRKQNGEIPTDKDSYEDLRHHLKFCEQISDKIKQMQLSQLSGRNNEESEGDRLLDQGDMDLYIEQQKNQLALAQTALEKVLASFLPSRDKACQTEALGEEGSLAARFSRLQKDHEDLQQMLMHERNHGRELRQHIRKLEESMLKQSSELAEEKKNRCKAESCVKELKAAMECQEKSLYQSYDVLGEQKEKVLHLKKELETYAAKVKCQEQEIEVEKTTIRVQEKQIEEQQKQIEDQGKLINHKDRQMQTDSATLKDREKQLLELEAKLKDQEQQTRDLKAKTKARRRQMQNQEVQIQDLVKQIETNHAHIHHQDVQLQAGRTKVKELEDHRAAQSEAYQTQTLQLDDAQKDIRVRKRGFNKLLAILCKRQRQVEWIPWYKGQVDQLNREKGGLEEHLDSIKASIKEQLKKFLQADGRSGPRRDSQYVFNSTVQLLKIVNFGIHVQSTGPEFRDQLIRKMQEGSIYRMMSSPKGTVVLINNVCFKGLSTRRGSERDEWNLRELFAQIGFEVKVHRDVTKKGLLAMLDSFSRGGLVGDSFVLVVLSHGAEGVVFSSGMERIHIEEDLKTRIRRLLPGRPKMLKVVACQGSRDYRARVNAVPDADDEERETVLKTVEEATGTGVVEVTQETADLIIAYSTEYGYSSWRHTSHGSVYVQEFVRVCAEKCHDTSVQEMLMIVRDRLSQRRLREENNGDDDDGCQGHICQISKDESTLRKPWYWVPGSTAEIPASQIQRLIHTRPEET